MPESLRFQHYEVVYGPDGTPLQLGAGAMGITYKALDTNLRCHVALKVINAAFLQNETARQRFLREARAAAQLRHPNVAVVFHLGQVDGEQFFYAMELIEGETFDALVRREGKLDPRFALELTLQASRALAAAYERKLLHRDIKPANLMLTRHHGEPLVKVIDFGLAKAVRPEDSDEAASGSPLTKTMGGGFIGTPYYASPEQIEGLELDTRSDIYSLGVTLWFMLTGRPLFEGNSMARVASQHLTRRPPLETLTQAPAPLRNLLERMLVKEPADRPQDPVALRDAILLCLRQMPESASDTDVAAVSATVLTSETRVSRGTSNAAQGTPDLHPPTRASTVSTRMEPHPASGESRTALNPSTTSEEDDLPTLILDTPLHVQPKLDERGRESEPLAEGLLKAQDAAPPPAVVPQTPVGRGKVLPRTPRVKTALRFVGLLLLLEMGALALWFGLAQKKKSPPSAPPATASDPSSPAAMGTPAPVVTAAPLRTDAPWKNSLGMPFVPVEEGLLAAIWPTRVSDFSAFVAATGYDATGGMYFLSPDGRRRQAGKSWKDPGFTQGPTHPVVGVNYEDATAFCAWLTRREREAGLLPVGYAYRLPTEAEWNHFAGPRAAPTADPSPVPASPVDGNVFPWGSAWPPPPRVGNYAGSEVGSILAERVPDFDDGFARASPVGTFSPNAWGLYDMGGNVWQWYADLYKAESRWRVARGGSWLSGSPAQIRLDARRGYDPAFRHDDIGFRCVLAAEP